MPFYFNALTGEEEEKKIVPLGWDQSHVFNATDAVFVQDAVDNSQYNSYGDKTHSAHNAEVFLGTPRYFNVGLSVNF